MAAMNVRFVNKLFCAVFTATLIGSSSGTANAVNGSAEADGCNASSVSSASAVGSGISPNSVSKIGARCKEDPSCVVVGGTHILEWKSPASAGIIVVCIHGLGLCARAYKPLAKELSDAGIDGFGVNVRGFGPDRDQPGRVKLDLVDTVGDVRQLLESIHNEHPDYKVFLVGESMGGALAVRIAAENDGLVDGVVCSAPAWKLLKTRRTAAKGVVELVLFPRSSPGPAGRAIMHQATSNPELTQHWLSDPSHKLKLTLSEATAFLSFISKTDGYAKQLTTPVLVVQGLNDHLVSPNAVARLFADIPSTNKTFLVDGTGEHLVLEEGGYTPVVVEKLVNWMKVGAVSEPHAPQIEAVNTANLSSNQKSRLSKLLRLSRHSKPK